MWRSVWWALLAIPAASPAVAEPDDRWVVSAHAGPVLDGVWRSRGYGRILRIRHGQRSLYHVAGTACYPDPAPDGAIEGHRLVSVAGRIRITFTDAPGGTRYDYDRVNALPPSCLVRQTWTVPRLAALIARTFDDLYSGFGPRGRTRAGLAAALATPDGASDPAFFRHVAAALEGLDDAHVGLSATIHGIEQAAEGGEAATIRQARADPRLGADPEAREAAWSRAYRAGIVDLLEGGGRTVANRRILWGWIGGVGYLNVVTMGAFDPDAAPDDVAALDRALDEAVAAFRGLPGVIVDVTNNRGGYDAVSLHIAGRFADRRRLAYTKRAVGSRSPPQRFFVEPSARLRYTGPVTLLTGDVTVSAGETFVLAMRVLPHVTHMGGVTRGALSDQLSKPLPNGWTLTLPAETYHDPAGRSHEGIGIAPTVPLAPRPSHAAMVRALADRMAVRGP